MVAWIHFLVPWRRFHGCLVKVPVCLDSVPGVLELVPWLYAEGSWTVASSAGLGSMVHWPWFPVVWIHFLLAWTLLHDCLAKVSGSLDSLPGSLVKVPWLSGEGAWLPESSS